MFNNVTHVCLVEKASELQEVNDVLILHMGSDTATCLHNTTRIVKKMLLLFVQLHMFPGGHFQVRLQNIRKNCELNTLLKIQLPHQCWSEPEAEEQRWST